jgi:hypothetical protein
MTSEERVQELWLQLAEYERFVGFEEKEIAKLEKKMKELKFKLKMLEIEKKTMVRNAETLNAKIISTRARLEAHNQG